MPPNLTCFTSNASSSILCWNSSSLSLFNSATKCYISRRRLTKNREWAVIKSSKTRLWLDHKNHGDIWRSSAYRENEMRWHTMFNQFSDLSPDNKQSSHTGKENISRQTFKRKRFTFAEPWTSGCLLLWIWFFHDISGHIRDFLFPSCQNNLVVYKWVAAFVSGVIHLCSSTNSHFFSAIWSCTKESSQRGQNIHPTWWMKD